MTSTRWEYVSDPNAVWNVPVLPGGVTSMMTTASAAEEMTMWAIFGRADGASMPRSFAPASAMELARGLPLQPPFAALDAVRWGQSNRLNPAAVN